MAVVSPQAKARGRRPDWGAVAGHDTRWCLSVGAEEAEVVAVG